jgi:hypothetical protein
VTSFSGPLPRLIRPPLRRARGWRGLAWLASAALLLATLLTVGPTPSAASGATPWPICSAGHQAGPAPYHHVPATRPHHGGCCLAHHWLPYLPPEATRAPLPPDLIRAHHRPPPTAPPVLVRWLCPLARAPPSPPTQDT